MSKFINNFILALKKEKINFSFFNDYFDELEKQEEKKKKRPKRRKK